MISMSITHNFNTFADAYIRSQEFESYEGNIDLKEIVDDVLRINLIDDLLVIRLDDPPLQIKHAKEYISDDFGLEWHLNKRHMTDYIDVDVKNINYYISAYFSICNLVLLCNYHMKYNRDIFMFYSTDAHDESSEFPSHVFSIAQFRKGDEYEYTGIDHNTGQIVISTKIQAVNRKCQIFSIGMN